MKLDVGEPKQHHDVKEVKLDPPEVANKEKERVLQNVLDKPGEGPKKISELGETSQFDLGTMLSIFLFNKCSTIPFFCSKKPPSSCTSQRVKSSNPPVTKR